METDWLSLNYTLLDMEFPALPARANDWGWGGGGGVMSHTTYYTEGPYRYSLELPHRRETRAVATVLLAAAPRCL